MLRREYGLAAALRLFDPGRLRERSIAPPRCDENVWAADHSRRADRCRRAPTLAFLEIDAAILRGKERSERIFALLGDATVASSTRFRALQASIGAVNRAMMSNDHAAAQVSLAECRALDWPGLGSLLDIYRARLQ